MRDDAMRLAVLIDAENAHAKIIDQLMAEAAKLGIATVKRIYGNFRSGNTSIWSDDLLRDHSIKPMHQINNTKGKNASDIGMVIDAMDLLHSGKIDGFCIVSSDSDFTGLASRIREEGISVYGFGEKKTPKSFIAACDRFTYTETLSKKAEQANKTEKSRILDTNGNPLPIALFLDAVEDTAEDDGWTSLSRIGQVISNQRPDFDQRNFGYRKLSDLIQETGLFELQHRGKPGGPQHVYVRRISAPENRN